MSETEVKEEEIEEERGEKRLFIGGLFPEVKPEELERRFAQYGTVKGTEIKIRKDTNGKPTKTFAYIDLETSDRDLRKCMNAYTKARWHGRELKVQEAKENFMKKLEKEREERMECDMEKTVQLASVSGIQNKLMSISDINTAANFNMRGAVPGTRVPGQENWVVGKYGRVLPVVNLKKNGSCKLLKVDPSKLTHNLRKIKDEKSDATVSHDGLTWQLDEDDNEISRKRKGQFPEWKPHKVKMKDHVNGEAMETDFQRRIMEVVDSDRTYRNSDFQVVPVSEKSGAASAVDKAYVGQMDLNRFDSDSEGENIGFSPSVSNNVTEGLIDLSRFNSDSEDDTPYLVRCKSQSTQSIGSVIKLPEKHHKAKANISPLKSDITINEPSSKDFQRTRQTVYSSKMSMGKMFGIQNLIDEYSSGFNEVESNMGNPAYVTRQSVNDAADYFDDDDGDSDFEVFAKKEMKKIESVKSKPNHTCQNDSIRVAVFNKESSLNQTGVRNVTEKDPESNTVPTTTSKSENDNTSLDDNDDWDDDDSSDDSDDDNSDFEAFGKKEMKEIESTQLKLTHSSHKEDDRVKPQIIEGKKTLLAFRGTKCLTSDNIAKSCTSGTGKSIVMMQKDTLKDNKIQDDKTKVKDNDIVCIANTEGGGATKRLESVRNTKASAPTQFVKTKLLLDEFSSGLETVTDAITNYSSEEEEDDDSDFENFVKKEMKKIESKQLVINAHADIDKENCEDLEIPEKGQYELNIGKHSSSDSSESDDSESGNGNATVSCSLSLHVDDEATDIMKESSGSSFSESDDDGKGNVVDDVDDGEMEEDVSTDDVDGEMEEDISTNDDDNDDDDDDDSSNDRSDDESGSSGSDFETLISKAINEIQVPRSLDVNCSSDSKVTKDIDTTKYAVSDDNQIENLVNVLEHKAAEGSEDSRRVEDERTMKTGRKRFTLDGSGGISESSDSDNDTDVETESTESEGETESSTDIDDTNESEATTNGIEKIFESGGKEIKMVNVDSSDTLKESEQKKNDTAREKSNDCQDISSLDEKRKIVSHLKDPVKGATSRVENKAITNKARQEPQPSRFEQKSMPSKIGPDKQSPKIEDKAGVDKKRLQAVKQRQKESMAQKSAIKNALSNLDEKKKVNTKIVFDSDSGEDEVAMETDEKAPENVRPPQGKDLSVELKATKSKSLFASDDDEDDDDDTDTDRFNIREEFEGAEGRKLAKLQSRFGNDERFKLDARFIESGSEDEEEEKIEEEDETTRSMRILQSVVGAKAVGGLLKQDKAKKKFKDIGALQYDPSKDEHQQFEVKSQPKDEAKGVEKKNSAVPIPKTLRTNQLSLDNRFSVRDDVTESESEMDAEDLDDQTRVEEKVDTTNQTGKPETVVKHSASFFFTKNDERLKDGIPNKQGTDMMNADWFEKRRHLIANYKSKHKNLRRKKGSTHQKRGGKRR